jgi:ribonucleoside-triphosphate reductase (formate)
MSVHLKGWYVKQTFENDFVNLMESLYKKYGEDVFSIQGIANRHMDIVQFSKEFFSKSGSVADISIDANANVKEKNILQYNQENNKSLMKLNSLYLLYKWVKETFDEASAAEAIEKVISGELFINDLTNVNMPYCYAFDLRELLMNGMNFFKGNMSIKPPRRSDTFMALIIQSTAYISNQIVGAASYPDFFVILDFFYRREKGESYTTVLRRGKRDHDEGLDTHDAAEWYHVKNQFQNFIYSMNFPFRGSQSAFTNLSVMDHGFLKTLLNMNGNKYLIPDTNGNFHEPDIHSVVELSKLFFEYYTDINGKEGIFTFPVMTLAVSIDEKGDLIDPEFADWAAEANSKKALANIFQSSPTSFSSCCRLRNDFSKVADAGYHNSFGVGGLSIGSHRVAGLNLPRIAVLEKGDPGILQRDLELLHKVLYAHRQLLKHHIDSGNMPLYTHGWIHLRKQYSTIGFIGAHEYVSNNDINIRSDEGIDYLARMLKTVEDSIVRWQADEASEGNIYNIEQIPGESMAVRLCELDTKLGFNPKGHQLYSNQYIPLVENGSIYDRFRIQGKIDSLTTGGAILHINVDDEKPLSTAQFKKMMEMARKTGTVYFAINYAYSECAKEHYLIGKHEVCTICGEKIVRQYTRVVGFLTPVSSWNRVRRDWEYPKRVFYRNGQLTSVGS